MRRGFALLIGLLTLAGCATGPNPKPEEPAHQQVEQTPPEPDTSLAALRGEPVDWATGDPLAIRQGICQPQPRTDEPLAVQVRQVEWKQHPLATEPFWVPTVALVLCNPTQQATKELFISLERRSGEAWDSIGSIGPLALQPGDGLGPIRFYANDGLPARMLAGVEPEGFPDWHFRLTALDRRFSLEFGGDPAENGLGGSPDRLRMQAWDQANGLFLYAPDARYSVQADPYCGAVPGQINAHGKHWALYASKREGEPRRLLDLGEYSFEGGRGLRVETVPALKTTFIGLEQYGSCAIPTTHDLYAYDHATGEAYRVLGRGEDGSARPMSAADFTISPEGRLENRFYLNAGEHAGWHTVIYRWEAGERTWVEEARSITK